MRHARIVLCIVGGLLSTLPYLFSCPGTAKPTYAFVLFMVIFLVMERITRRFFK
jgi:hypothetical protein